ncbi:MAG TPA: PAS domain S-box protein [Gallionellaceae bacterium]
MNSEFVCNLPTCKKVEDAMRGCDEKFRSAFDLIHDSLLVLDQHGHIVDINRTGHERLGYPKEEMLGMHITQLNAPTFDHQYGERMALVEAHGHAMFESAHQHRDGHSIPVEVSVRRIELQGEPMLFSVVRDLSERRRAERALQMMQRSVDRMVDGAYWLTPDGRVVYANEAACRALGYSQEEMLQLSVFDFDPAMRPEQWPMHWQRARELGSHTVESIHRTRQGQEIPVEVTVNHFSYEGEEFHCTFVRDISARKQAQRALKMMQFAMDNMSDAVFWSAADGRIAYANIAACRSLGYTPEEMLKLRVYDFATPTSAATWAEHWHELKALRSHTFESMHRTRDGREFPVEISVNHMQYDNEEYMCGFARDITLRKLTDQRIARMAHYDALTGLPNRSLLYDRLEQAIAQANRYRQQLAVLFLDLDGFKQINDTFGHYVGDDLLKAVAERLRDCARDMDTVARVGGDEFVFILHEIGQPEHAALVARKILTCLTPPFAIQGKSCQVSGSIGIALFPADGGNMEEIIRLADDAMYVAKNNGKNNYQFASQMQRSPSL